MDKALTDHKRLAVQFLELATSYRTDECLVLMTCDATWVVMGEPGRLAVAGSKDRTQIARLLGGLAKFIPNPLELSVTGITAEADRVAVEAECVGQWRNGTLYRNSYHFLFEVRDGRIARVREYMDTLHLFDTLEKDRR